MQPIVKIHYYGFLIMCTAMVSKLFVKMLGRINMCAIFSLKGCVINVPGSALLYSFLNNRLIEITKGTNIF